MDSAGLISKSTCAGCLLNYFSNGSHGASLGIRSLVKCVRKFEHWQGNGKSKKPWEKHHVWKPEFKWVVWGGSFRLDTEGSAGGYKWEGFAVQCYCFPGSGAHALAAECSEGRTRHCCSPGISPVRHWCISTAPLRARRAQLHPWATADGACRKDFCCGRSGSSLSKGSLVSHPGFRSAGKALSGCSMFPSQPPPPQSLFRLCSPLPPSPVIPLCICPEQVSAGTPPDFTTKWLFLERWGRQERKRSTKPAARDPSRSCHLHSPQPQELWVFKLSVMLPITVLFNLQSSCSDFLWGFSSSTHSLPQDQRKNSFPKGILGVTFLLQLDLLRQSKSHLLDLKSPWKSLEQGNLKFPPFSFWDSHLPEIRGRRGITALPTLPSRVGREPNCRGWWE